MRFTEKISPIRKVVALKLNTTEINFSLKVEWNWFPLNFQGWKQFQINC